MLRTKIIATLAAVALLSSSRAGAAGPARDLVGLWHAVHLRNGPEIRGSLILRRNSGLWQAQIAGVEAPVDVAGRSVAFKLPGGLGSFVGSRRDDGKAIFGHWIQPPTVDSGTRYASPVTLLSDGPNAWRGVVDPLDDHMAFYLVVRPPSAETPADTNPAFVTNPERNLGWMWRVNRLVRSGDAVTLATSTGRNQAVGVYRVDDDILSFYFSGRGGTYDFERVPADSWMDFYPRGRPTPQYTYAPPPENHDGWAVGNLRDVGISQRPIEAFVQSLIDAPIDSERALQIHGILLARHGKLVLEEYFHGENRDRPHETRSAAKSITATLFGAAIQAGLPVSTSTHVYSAMNGGRFPANLSSLKRSLTVESLLTMSSGFDCDDDNEASPGYEDSMTQDPARPNVYQNTLALNIIRPPGTKWAYCSVGANMVGGVLTRATGQSLPVLFHNLLAKPLQIERYYLPLQPTGEPYMGGDVRLLPRDFMKFGQVMLNGGTWNGSRILSRAWCVRASSPLIKTTTHVPEYGYLWWLMKYPYKGGTLQAFAALGNGGEDVIVIPKLDIVIAIYAGTYADGPVSHQIQERFLPDYILPAIVN